MDIVLRDDHNIKIPQYTQMFIGDSSKQADYNRSKLLESLGPRVKILATIDTSRSGTIVNGRVYPAKEMKAGNATWTFPFRKPFLKQHPAQGMFSSGDEPLVQGRIVGGKFVSLKDDLINDWINPPFRDEGSGMVLNSVEISDKEAVEAIIDGRMLTVSVGMTPNKILCPFCQSDWAAAMRQNGGPPEKCDHRPGNAYDAEFKTFKGKMPFYFVTRGITYDHIASTFRPAQPYAAIRGWEAMADSLALSLGGEMLNGEMASLALCDEAGHIVRLGVPEDEERAAPPLSEAEAVVLASMETAGVLDLGADSEDGWDAADISSAIQRVRADGTFQKYQSQFKGKVIGTNGAIPISDSALADAGLKVLGRYTGRNRDLIGLRLMDVRSKAVTPKAEPVVVNTEADLPWEEVEKLSDSILDKIKDLPENAEICDDVLQKVLDAELCKKVSFVGAVTDSADELERELEGVASGVIAADKKLTTESRNKLPDTAFCGPDRSFPAHDESHVRNGLSQLPKAKLSSSQKAKVRACLIRKGKKYGVGTNNNGDSAMELEKELRDTITKLEKEIADAKAANSLLQRDFDAAKVQLEEVAKAAHDSLVSEVFELRVKLAKPDVKQLDEAAKKAYLEKMAVRSDESLKDSLSDLKCEVVAAASAPAPVITDTKQVEPPPNQGGTQAGVGTKEPEKKEQKSNKDKIREAFRASKK